MKLPPKKKLSTTFSVPVTWASFPFPLFPSYLTLFLDENTQYDNSTKFKLTNPASVQNIIGHNRG